MKTAEIIIAIEAEKVRSISSKTRNSGLYRLGLCRAIEIILEHEEINYQKSETKTTMVCGDCGQKLTEVRPGKYQCDNQKCKRNNQ